jgi:hypothetical protein
MKEMIELVISYEVLMLVDGVPANERNTAINASVRRIIEFFGLRELEASLGMSRIDIPSYLYGRIDEKCK